MERGILLVNLGSPESPSVPDVRKYLHQFLMDKRVIDVPYILRKIIVGTTILPFRPKRSAQAYRTIWWKDGSPLIVISRKVQKLLQERLDIPVELAMRYGNPSIRQGIQNLLERGNLKLDEIFLMPLYPHYAMASYETVVVEAEKVMVKIKSDIKLKVLQPFYDNPMYIKALTESAKKYLASGYDHLLFSYHGLPERHLKKSDPTGQHCLMTENCCQVSSAAKDTCYRHQVLKTTQLFTEALGIPQNKYSVSFQSRLGNDPWIKPFTTDELQRLPADGVKKLLVICPAFVSDCLETLEEIKIGAKEIFLAAGGKEFQAIPCLNDHPLWIETLRQWCLENELIHEY